MLNNIPWKASYFVENLILTDFFNKKSGSIIHWIIREEINFGDNKKYQAWVESL